jgi:antitoxin PrlF
MPTMTSKGQVTIPKRLRDYLGLKPGMDVAFDLECSGKVVILPGKKRPKSRFAKFRGTATAGLSTDEIMRLTRGDEWPDLK